jgi:hypothetical protein
MLSEILLYLLVRFLVLAGMIALRLARQSDKLRCYFFLIQDSQGKGEEPAARKANRLPVQGAASMEHHIALSISMN